MNREDETLPNFKDSHVKYNGQVMSHLNVSNSSVHPLLQQIQTPRQGSSAQNDSIMDKQVGMEEESKRTIIDDYDCELQPMSEADREDVEMGSNYSKEQMSTIQDYTLDEEGKPEQSTLEQFGYGDLQPHEYQMIIYNKIKKNWINDDQQIGNIVYLETGTGKTYIAIMLLKYLFSEWFVDNAMIKSAQEQGEERIREVQQLVNHVETDQDLILTCQRQETLNSKQFNRSQFVMDQLKNENKTIDQILKTQKKAIFLITTQNLVEQQANTIDRYTELSVGKFQGGQKNSSQYSSYEKWQRLMVMYDVLVIVAKKFYDFLMHGFIHIEEIDLIIFDECHHTDQDHLYNLIMKDFFFHGFDFKNPEKTKRPKIIGLTASPIKQQIEKDKILHQEIEDILQRLSNNLYSRFVTKSENEIKNHEQDLQLDIRVYHFDFDQTLQTLEIIEKMILSQMSEIIKFPLQAVDSILKEENLLKKKSTYQEMNQVSNCLDESRIKTEQLLFFVQENVYKQTVEDQDTQILKFLNGRKQLIKLNNTFTKKNLNLDEFEQYEDKMLLILCIIMVKNINNLLIELGPLAVKNFFLDLKRDLLLNKVQSSVTLLGSKSEKAISIIDQFCNQQKEAQQNDLDASILAISSNSEIRDRLNAGKNVSEISNKVKELIQILKKSYENDNDVRTIIFVKDRSVAFYLKMLLSGANYDQTNQQQMNDDSIVQGLDSSYAQQLAQLKEGMLDPEKFRIGFAMGFKSRNLINKAYRSLNTQCNDILSAVRNNILSCRSIKLTQNQLQETLEKFRTGQLNILIATNVVEEGLDVSKCNQVICMNELLTVKAFIQMKGRARRAYSKFVFLCANEEKNKMEQNQKQFRDVISSMKQIAQLNKLMPNQSVLSDRIQSCKDQYFKIDKTGAKVSQKEARQLIETFCILFQERFKLQIKEQNGKSVLRMVNLDGSYREIESMDSINASHLALDFKPNYVTKEIVKEGQVLFFCELYFPKTCHDLIKKKNPNYGFRKKKEAENHVALLAVEKLYNLGYFNDYLLPKMDNAVLRELHPKGFQAQSFTFGQNQNMFAEDGTLLNHVQLNQQRQKLMSSLQNVNKPERGPPQPRKTTIITDEERKEERNKHKQFEAANKQVEFPSPPNQINIRNFTNHPQGLYSLYVYVFKGQDINSEFPFRNTSDFLGILFDKKFSNPQLNFLLYQEQRGYQKNKEHLKNLVRKDLCYEEARLKFMQNNDYLTIALDNRDCFKVEGPLDSSYQNEQILSAKIQCYHTWLFYYLYSADFRFMKDIFARKFQFVDILFRKDFKKIFKLDNNGKFKHRSIAAKKFALELFFTNKQGNVSKKASNFEEYIKFINGKRVANAHKFDNEIVPLLPYTVPVTSRKPFTFERVDYFGGSTKMKKLRIDWATIERVVQSIQKRIYDIVLPTEREIVLHKYNLEDPVRESQCLKPMKYNQNRLSDADLQLADVMRHDRVQMTPRLWDQNFQGNRVVILSQEQVHKSEESPIDLTQGGKEIRQEIQDFKQSSLQFLCQNRMERLQRQNEISQNMMHNNAATKNTKLNIDSEEFFPKDIMPVSKRQQQEYKSKYGFQSNFPEYAHHLQDQESQFSMISRTLFSNLQAQTQQLSMSFQHQSKIVFKQFKTREYYFLKHGIFLNRLYNKYIIKCRKERHFLDFGKKRRDDEEQQLIAPAMFSHQGSNNNTMSFFDGGSGYYRKNAASKGNDHYKHQKMNLKPPTQMDIQSKKKTNTEFDIPDQMLTLSPITYNQYQVLQTTCFNMLNFNELLMIEKFINDTFGDLKCLLKVNEANDLMIPMEPASEQTDILHTFEQISERVDPTKVQQEKVTNQLMRKIHLVKEALSSPGACRENDYERLEFFGDSIIGFLVILELFVTQPTMVEGDLDFKRIKKVSNHRFYDVNKDNQFYNFMITESHQIYSGYDHAGFDDISKTSQCTCNSMSKNYNNGYKPLVQKNNLNHRKNCQQMQMVKRASAKIAQKHYNELCNKLMQLKLIKQQILLIKNSQDILEQLQNRGNIYLLFEMIKKEPELEDELLNANKHQSLEQSSYVDTSLNQSILQHPQSWKDKVVQLASQLFQFEISPRTILLKNIDKVIKRVDSQIQKNKNKSEGKSRRVKGPFYYKQLADVVESVTGAVSLACGLNCAQDYLRKIGVLEHDQAHLMSKMMLLQEQQEQKTKQLEQDFFVPFNMNEVEKIIGHEFNCKAWLIEALTHKSYPREFQNTFLDDYERLEFLGDAVLGYLMAKYFFMSTQNDETRKNPKELHKMKTSVINNNLLSLIIIENNIDNYIIYNKKAAGFKQQFDSYVDTVHQMIETYGSTKQIEKKKLDEKKKKMLSQTFRLNQPEDSGFFDPSLQIQDETLEEQDGQQLLKEFDLDELHEHNLKIFGDVFESLIGAVFLDSQDIEKTWKVLSGLIMPYVNVYADLDTLQDHSRTLLLEMWNQKPYTKNLRCMHKTEDLDGGERSKLTGIILLPNRKPDEGQAVFSEVFTKDAKSKVRTFYKHFYLLVKKFVDEVDMKSLDDQKMYSKYPNLVIDRLRNLDMIDKKTANDQASCAKAKQNGMKEAQNGLADLAQVNEETKQDK